MALVQTAAERLAGLKTRLEQLPQTAQQAQERLSAVTAQRSDLDRQLRQAQQIGADTRAAQGQIEQLDRELAGAREAAQADYSLALAELDELQTALAAQQQQVAAAYEQRYFVTRTVPISAVSIAMLLAVAIVSGLRWRHTRLKRRVVERLSAFRSEVTRWMERLDGLKQRHQYLPFTDDDFTEPMTGQTLVLYNEVQARYDTLRTLWLALMDRRTKAEGVFELENSLGVKRLMEVDQLLAGREDTTQLEPQFRQSVEMLDRLNQAHDEAAQARQKVEMAQAALAERIALLSQADLPTEPLEIEVSEAREAFQRGIEIVPSDPLGGREAFEGVHRQLTALDAVCQRRLACVGRVRGLEQQVAAARQRVLELRSGGIKLSEASADPDALLSEAARRLTESWTALEQANDAAAETLVEQAGVLAADARQRTEQHLADREFTLQQTPRLREGLAALRERLKQAFAQQQELEAAFHRDSWSLVAENASHAGALIETLAGLLERATGAAAEDMQHYSLAAQHLKEGELTRQQAQALIAAVGLRLDELQKLRSQAATRRREVAESSRRVETFLGQHTHIVGDEAQGLWSQAQASLEQAEAAAGHSQPHWPQILAELDRAAGALAAALERAENDVRSHALLMAELSQARARAASVGQLLRSHTADRPRANQRFQGALEVIEAIARASDQPGAAWARLLEELRQAAADVEQSRRWAEEDIRLAEQAAGAVRSAESEFQRSRTFVSFGVSTNMSAAESQLAQARHQLQSQHYEQAISLAEAAERAARQAHLEAVREADERRRRQEDERRRREMQRMAASAAAMTMGSRRSGGSFSSPSSRSTSSSSSWSSGTSQSSW
jgi:hypothetical protein